MKKNLAFTLAEVLITLGVIGIVAAMTLPALITRNQNKALEAALKKNYSVLQQAFERYQADTGERLKPEDVSKRVNGADPIGSLKSAIQPYLKVLKDCGQFIAASNACVSSAEGLKKYKTYSKKTLSTVSLFDDGQLLLSDGSLLLFENAQGSTTAYITIDVNGFLKNPNQWGHDLFTFQLMSDGRLMPMGAPGTNYYSNDARYCSSSSTHHLNGIGCTYYALTEKDYFNNLPR